MLRDLGGLLALSVLLNAALLVAYMVERGEEPSANHAVELANSDDVAEDRGACAGCEGDLKECRETSWETVAEAMERRAADMLDGEGDDGGAPDDDDEAKPAVALRADPSVQQDALSQIAREHLRRHWESTEEEVLAIVQRDLTDPGKQHDDLERDVGQLTGVLAIGDDRAGAFGDEYAKLRAARIDVARKAVTQDPPDWAGVLAAARGLFDDEDKLAEKFGGVAGRDRVRLSQLEKRTALLGILATYADQAWGDEIIW